MKNNRQSDFIIFKTQDEKVSVDVRFEDETVWLTQDQMAMLFDKAKSTISEHIKHIFEEGELNENSVVRNFRTTAADGKNYIVNYYNLDVIISVGYRVKSLRGTQFRQWATKRLNEYIRKGFTMDDERLKNLGGGGYWKELLQRIRDIRASEKVFYRQVLDIYATSIDYDPKADVSIAFFKKVQNKIHYAVHGHTAAEVIFNRVDAEKQLGSTFRTHFDHERRKTAARSRNGKPRQSRRKGHQRIQKISAENIERSRKKLFGEFKNYRAESKKEKMSTYITENTIEEFTIKLLAHNDYEYIYAPNIAHDGETPERTSYEEVLLLGRLRESIRRINPTIPPEIQDEAVKELNRIHSPELITNNENFHRMLTEGIKFGFNLPFCCF